MADSSDEDVVDYKNDYIVSDDEEDIMPSEPDSSEDDDDDDDFYNDKFSRFKIELKKDEMASDLEDGDENEDNLPSSLAWGKDKKLFYNTDFIDRDYRSQKSKEEDLAQYEEQEALAIQKRLLESINENDLGLDFMIDTKPKQVTKKQLIEEDYYEKKREKIELDLSTLKSEQKLDIIRRESPELELLISDCKKYLKELNDQLDPILNNLLENDPISSTGLKYLKLRYMVLLNYCTNVSYYLSLMSSHDKSKVKDHPIIKDIFMHKKLISQLDSYQKQNGKLFTKELDYVSKLLEQPNPQIDFMSENVTVAEEEIYDLVNNSKLAAFNGNENEDNMPIDDNVYDDEGEDEKRAITYEMEKNKGLIAKRKREQRNPRVKYRKKYENAIVRRRGQVREPRKEIRKYSGEHTGINVRAVKSVKFK